MLALRRELEDAQATQVRERESRRKDHEDEVRRLREKCERLENERDGFMGAEVCSSILGPFRQSQ